MFESPFRAVHIAMPKLLENWTKVHFPTKSIPPFHGPCLVLSNRVFRDHFLQEATLEAATRYHRKKPFVLSFFSKNFIFCIFQNLSKTPNNPTLPLLIHHPNNILSSFQHCFSTCRSLLPDCFSKVSSMAKCGWSLFKLLQAKVSPPFTSWTLVEQLFWPFVTKQQLHHDCSTN